MALSFVQQLFNDISLRKDEKLWLSENDSLNQDRIQLIASFGEVTKFASQLNKDTSPALRIAGKNDKLSSALSEKAMLAYAQGELEYAVQLLNQSLQFCPSSTKNGLKNEVSQASLFAQRAAIWCDLKDWDLALRDCQLAMSINYDEEIFSNTQLIRIKERHAEALFSIGEIQQAQEVIQDALKILGDSKIKKHKQTSMKEQLLKLEKTISKDKKYLEMRRLKSSKEIPKLKNPLSKFPTFSDALRISYEKGRGRFIIAERDIEIGELIAVENAHVAMLDKDEIKRLCWHCFLPLRAPVPCDTCSGVLFCNDSCREISSNSYHKYECGITELMFQANIGAWVLAYRAIVSKPRDFYLKQRERFVKHNEKSGFEEQKVVYDSLDIETFHNLVTHDGSGQKEPPELMMQALVAVFLLRCLQFKGYLQESDSLELSENDVFFCKLLHHFMRVTYFNTHEVTIVESGHSTDAENVSQAEEDDTRTMNIRRVGRVTNPSLALINHSCSPNYRRISHGTTTFGFATKTIRKGEEICDTYSKMYVSATKDMRRRALQKYNFECQCYACENDWPLLRHLPDKVSELPPECYKASVTTKDAIKSAVKKIANADAAIAKLKRGVKVDKEALKDAQIRYCKELENLLAEPHYKLVIAENNLFQVLLSLYARKSKEWSY